MSKKKKVSQKDTDRKYLEINGKTVRFFFYPPKASIYKYSSIIILKGKSSPVQVKKTPKLLEFLSRAPISFEEE